MSKTPRVAGPGPAQLGSRSSVPQRIGDFEVIKSIGNGSFGKVKLAKHIITGHKVAMKFISKKKIATSEMSDRVQREIQYLGMLQHPHIIKLYDVTQTQESIVMVIEYLKGELFDYIVKTGRMVEPQARRFFQQIIAAVEYCHSNDIVHRDLKPENLLLDEQLNVKIADFGLSNVMKDGDFLKTSCGSPNYAAPEVISGKSYSGPEIDIWSCGVILYVMLCGRLPFDDDHIPMLFKKINGGIFSLPPYLSPGARHLLQRMLLVDSNKRITLAEIRQLPWFQEGLPSYLAKPARRRHVSDVTNSPTSDGIYSSADYLSFLGQGDDVSPHTEGSEWVAGLGYLEPEALKEVVGRYSNDYKTEDELVHALKEGKDKRIKIAYQLCADSYRAKLAAAQHNERGSGFSNPLSRSVSVRKDAKRQEESDEAPGPSHIRILEGTVQQQSLDANSLAKAKASRNPLNAGRGLQSMTQTEANSARTVPHNRKPKTRWHFGIRSRSPPLEVMLEIYRTLQTLGFDWKRKDEKEIQEGGKENGQPLQLTEEEVKKKKRRDEEERIKTGQALFFVEARCNIDGVMVYMDIQLYQVDENDNYLVDFRCLGYRPVLRQSPRPSSTVPPTDSGAESERGSFSLAPHTADEVRSSLVSTAEGLVDLQKKLVATAAPGTQVLPKSTGVSSPFLFLECACKLIVELAIGGGSN